MMMRMIYRFLLLLGILSIPIFCPGQENAAGPTLRPSDEYIIGAKDIINIGVYGEQELSGDYTVHEDGTIQFPLIKTVKIAGLSAAQAAEKIEKLLDKDYFNNVQLTLTVKEFRSFDVNVLGEVKNPGKKYFHGAMSLLDVLSDAGGLTIQAGDTITLQRQIREGSVEKTTTFQVNLDELIAGTSTFGQFKILPGDTITVNAKSFFYIQGEVAHPGQFEISRDLTILKAIALAGGLARYANEKDVEVHRVLKGQKQVIKVNLRQVKNGKAEDIFLLPSDTIIVNKRTF
jgi:polysaccharide biosynthesis/export protein